MTSVISPDMVAVVACKNLCKPDKDGRYCVGCGRSIEEIIQKGKDYDKRLQKRE
jgi:predicted Fe-S protein YdhL (DUF1289 family)